MKINKLFLLFITLSVSLILVIPLTNSCNSDTKENKNTEAKLSDTSTAHGESLALNYCQRCHSFPRPELLDKKTWLKAVLPNMGWRLGIRENGTNPYAAQTPEDEKIIRKLGVYPETPLISGSDWEEIKKYYENRAPADPLPQKKEFNTPARLSGFETKLIKFDDNPLPQMNGIKPQGKPWAQEAIHKTYPRGKPRGIIRLNDRWQIESAPTDIDFPEKGSPRLLTIGNFNPSDQKTGRLASLDTAKVLPKDGVFIESLPRPVQFAVGI